MAVQDFECQIARAQIGRYLQGDALSPEALDQLEDHIAECPGCKAVLSERRKALQEMLGWKGEEAPKTAVVQDPTPRPKSVQNKAILQLQQALASTKGAEAKKTTAWKPLVLSATLAVVLIGMSYMTKGNNSILGERVIEALPPAPAASTAATVEPPVEPGVGDAAGLSPATTVAPIITISDEEPAAEPITEQPDDTAALPVAEPVKQNVPAKPPTQETDSKPANAPAKPLIKKAAPQVQVKKTTPRRPTTQPAPAKPKQQPRTNSIRVYDENGNPIR